MGMFDDIVCHYPLPGLADPVGSGVKFQTKDLDCALDKYEITKDGRLVLNRWDWEKTPENELDPKFPFFGCIRKVEGSHRVEDTNYHGMLNFYGDVQTGELRALSMKPDTFMQDDLHPGPDPEWFEYNAKFTNGKIESVERVQ